LHIDTVPAAAYAVAMNSTHALCAALVLAVVTGCSPSFKLSPTAGVAPAAKPPGCAFKVVAALPSGPYEEVGILSQSSGWASDPEAFKQAVEADVCAVGGDVVVTEINGYGYYMRGVILRRTADK
jgi:hypothetical protein